MQLCRKYIGGPKRLRRWSRGHQFVVKGGGHCDVWALLYHFIIHLCACAVVWGMLYKGMIIDRRCRPSRYIPWRVLHGFPLAILWWQRWDHRCQLLSGWTQGASTCQQRMDGASRRRIKDTTFCNSFVASCSVAILCGWGSLTSLTGIVYRDRVWS